MLSLQSGVLRGLFTDEPHFRSPSSSKRQKTDGGVQGLVLEAPFQDASLFDTVLFLRLCYQPRDLSPTNLGTALGSLPSLLRLAHRLDALRIQQAVCKAMAGGWVGAVLRQATCGRTWRWCPGLGFVGQSCSWGPQNQDQGTTSTGPGPKELTLAPFPCFCLLLCAVGAPAILQCIDASTTMHS